jgi:hypothetical protein
MKDYKETMQQGREFIAANLAQCCKEELEWQNTALLCNGKLREAAAIFNTVDATHCMPIAQSEVARQAMALAASGGNAAPGLTIEKINELAAKHIQDICGVGRPPAPMGEDHEFVILCRAIEAASAPNAALVAALEELALLMSDVIRGEYEPDSFTLQPAVHALAAVGIEFHDDDYLLTKRESCKVVPLHPTSSMLKAMAESRASDDEGEYPAMLDLMDFSGENKTHTALRAAYVAALSAAGQEVGK